MRKSRAALEKELEDLRFLNDQGWLNYEVERRYNEILKKRVAALTERLSKFEHSMEYQQ